MIRAIAPIKDVDGFRRVAGRSAALGFDGKWVLHPGQIDAANEVYAPSQDDYDHAELILDAYDYYTSEAGGKRGAELESDSVQQQVTGTGRAQRHPGRGGRSASPD